ncbi:MAG: DUF502 domain-containing protein [Chloroflexi bacterium]|nr:DUF502 domain-containing protein [Chloroflexota bacterium]
MESIIHSQPKKARHFRNVFLAGAFVAGPMAVTYLAFRWLFDTLDGILQPIIVYALGRPLPGVGLVALVVLVYLLGLLTKHMIGRKILKGVDTGLSNTPIVQLVYRASRQIMDSARTIGDIPFNRVVMVDFPRPGVQSVGFVTGQAVSVNGEEKFPVFIATTPNPMSGFLIFVRQGEITDTNMSVNDALRMVISGGLSCPPAVSCGVPVPPMPQLVTCAEVRQPLDLPQKVTPA